MAWIINLKHFVFLVLKFNQKSLHYRIMQYLLGLTLSEMGIGPLLLVIIISFSILFIIAFGLSSKNMDSDGIMNWMMKKPENWIGNKKS
tara:strand:- start:567 stop:833 length:267 start_codon:yes stop_codon:yes gene_type:complete